MLGYRIIFVKKPFGVKKVFERARIAEMKQACVPIQNQSTAEVKNKSRWRMASFQSVRYKEYTGKARREFDNFKMERFVKTMQRKEPSGNI